MSPNMVAVQLAKQNALPSLSQSLGFLAVPSAMFPAKTDGSADSTSIINAATAYAITNKIGEVRVAAGTYKVDGTITITDSLNFVGTHLAPTSTTGQFVARGSTIFVASTPAVAGDPVIRVKHTTSGQYIAGTTLRDFYVLGSNHWNTSTGAVDRIGIHIHKVLSETRIDKVFVSGFLRQGFYFEELWDGTINNVRVMYCGTDGTYPAVDFYGTAQGNSNAVHVFGMHVEACEYMLRIDKLSRSNHFVGCKFELFSKAPTNSPITIDNGVENTFTACFFAGRNTDDTGYYANTSIQPHMITITNNATSSLINGVGFVNCDFVASPYSAASGMSAQDPRGARWIKAGNNTATITNCRFNPSWAGDNDPGIVLNDNQIFTGNRVWTRVYSAIRNCLKMGKENIVAHNRFSAWDPAETVTTGAVFTCTGARNIIGPNVIESQTVNTYLSASVVQKIIPSGDEAVQLATGTATLNVGWVDRWGSRNFQISNPGAQNVTTLTGALTGETVRILFSNSNTTMVHSAGLVLKGAVNATPANGQFMSFYTDGTNYYELSRSF